MFKTEFKKFDAEDNKIENFGKTIAIFGITGSFGTAMTEKILNNTHWNIIGIARNETKIFTHKQKFNSNRIKYVVGDIRNYDLIYNTLENVDYVILASAMKHINHCEENPEECLAINVNGCINVINAAINRNVEKLVFLSTDKATNATTLYGSSKLLVELYIKSVNNKNTKIMTTRYGNVFGSNGSVIYVFDKLSKEGKALTITNPDMTRFFMPLSEAVDLVWNALLEGNHKDLWVYKNKSATIQQIADLFNGEKTIIGNRCIEKTDEALLTLNELKHSWEDDKYYIVNENTFNSHEYDKPLTSDTAERLTAKELKEMLNDWRKNNE